MTATGRNGAAFSGVLIDLGFDWTKRTLVAHVALPLDTFDAFTKGVGTPKPPPAYVVDRGVPETSVCTVALMACRTPVHPEREGDVLAEAALRLLQQLLEAGRLSPVRATTIDRFRDVMDALGATLGLTPQTPDPEER